MERVFCLVVALQSVEALQGRHAVLTCIVVASRTKLLKDRRKAMYQNEYDRIKGIIAHRVLPQQTREHIEGRD